MKRNLRYLPGVLIILVFSFISSCHKKEQDTAKNYGESNSLTQGDTAVATSEITITRKQFESSGMKIGDPSPILFQKKVSGNGYIVASPSGWVKINTLIPGRVNKINHSEGDYIRKGDLLFTIESNEIILLQQDYAEAFNQFSSIKANYERQKALAEEKIISQKDFIETESDYRSLLSKTEGLKARLRLIHIDPAQVEKGNIIPESSIYSPIQGFITKMDLVRGQFIEPQATVMELIDINQLQLNLYIFENDLKDMAVGQKVLYYDPDDKKQIYEASLSSIGKAIDPETKTVLCKARIKPEDQSKFVNRLFVNIEIISNQHQVMAIPAEAASNVNGRYYVLVLVSDNGENLTFRKVPVHGGEIMQGYVEILDKDLKNVLIADAYNLFTED
jgi:cobalt-zinc-cadmium efflux system membrane fusion protein